MDYKDLRSIQETYSAMYSEEVVDEGLAGMIDKATKAGQAGLEKMGVKINRTPRPTARPSATTSNTMRQNQSSMEEVDVFDIVKGHLIDEGYADSEESALAIMTNMSENWKESILEGLPRSVTVIPPADMKNPEERKAYVKQRGAAARADIKRQDAGKVGRVNGRIPEFRIAEGAPYVVTAADKAGNTKAYQGLKAGKKNAVTGKPMYVAAPHLKGV